MSKEHRLERRGRRYYLRVVIPAAIRHLYPERKSREIRISLKTADKREARRLCQRTSLRLEDEFRAKRDLLMAARLTTRTSLTPDEERRLLALWTRSVLETDEQQRARGLDDEAFDAYAQALTSTETDLRALLPKGQLEAIEPALDGFLHLAGVDLHLDPQARRRLAYRFLQTAIQTVQLQRRRQQGEVVMTDEVIPPETVFQPGTPSSCVTFEAAFDLWDKARSQRPKKTVGAYRHAWDEFKVAMTVKDVRAITRAQVKAYVKDLESRGTHYRTVEKKLGMVASVLQRAVIEEILTVNPASRVEVVKPSVVRKPRLPYDVSELQRIFGHAHFRRQLELPRRAGGEAAYWLPALEYYTGARIEELAQLAITDIREAKGLGWYLSITDTGDGQHLKTTASRRRVPIRDELMTLGFLRYVERMKAEKQAQLFPALKPNADGTRSAGFTRWFGSFLREHVGIRDRRKTLNSFRHLMKEFCREAAIDSEVQRALMGHTRRTGKRDAAELYGHEEYPLKPLFAAMRKLEFPPEVTIPVLEPHAQ